MPVEPSRHKRKKMSPALENFRAVLKQLDSLMETLLSRTLLEGCSLWWHFRRKFLPLQILRIIEKHNAGNYLARKCQGKHIQLLS